MLESLVDWSLRAALLVSGGLLVMGFVTLIQPTTHDWLKRIVTGAWIVTAAVLAFGIVAIIAAPRTGDLPTSLGYLLVAAMFMPLLGIGRLGEPPAPGETRRDPHAPTLSQRQIAQIDGIAAMIVAVAYAVVVWRLTDVLAAA